MSGTPSGRPGPPDAGTPRVTVVVPTRDRPHLLNAALGSIAVQDVMRVHLVDLDRHSGAAAARNVGVEHAAGEYISSVHTVGVAAGCSIAAFTPLLQGFSARRDINRLYPPWKELCTDGLFRLIFTTFEL